MESIPEDRREVVQKIERDARRWAPVLEKVGAIIACHSTRQTSSSPPGGLTSRPWHGRPKRSSVGRGMPKTSDSGTDPDITNLGSDGWSEFCTLPAAHPKELQGQGEERGDLRRCSSFREIAPASR
jgi:hypothetical protein